MSTRNPRRNGYAAAPEGGAGSGSTSGARIELATPVEIDVASDRLGPVLGDRRRSLGLKLEEVAEEIKIRAEYLKALEEESFDDLPTPEYARLFLKTYAERLALNVSEVYALLDLCDHPGVRRIPSVTVKTPAISVPSPSTVRSGKLSIIAIATLALLAILMVVWLLLGGDQEQSNVAPPPAPVTSDIEGAGQQYQATTETGTTPVEPMYLVLHFGKSTWAVIAADSDTVVSTILSAGDSVTAFAEDRFLLTMGHTDSVTASIDGHPLVPFRNRAVRLSGLLLTRDSLDVWWDTTQAARAISVGSEMSPDGEGI